MMSPLQITLTITAMVLAIAVSVFLAWRQNRRREAALEARRDNLRHQYYETLTAAHRGNRVVHIDNVQVAKPAPRHTTVKTYSKDRTTGDPDTSGWTTPAVIVAASDFSGSSSCDTSSSSSDSGSCGGGE